MKKKILLGLASMLAFTGVVNAKSLDEDFNKIAPNGVFNIKAVKPVEASQNAIGEYYYPELVTYVPIQISKELGSNYYGYLENCNETLSTCTLVINKYDEETLENTKDEKEIEVKWEEGNATASDEIENYVKNINSKLDAKEATYYFEDLALINYLKNNKPDITKEVGYISDLKNEFDNSNVSYTFSLAHGEDSGVSVLNAGFIVLSYNDIMYKIVGNDTNMLKIYTNYIIYIPDDTKDTAEDFVNAAQSRLDEYLGSNVAKVEIGGLRSKYKYGSAIFSSLGSEAKMSDSYYKITINQETYDFVIIKDSSKIEKPVITTKDIATNVKVTTSSSEIPLDTKITVNEIKENSTEYKSITKVIKTKMFQAFDISLYSSSLNSNITKLENGSFTVTIPVNEELKNKKLYAYYIKDDNTLEEFEVTMDSDNNASFDVNHFSTYIISEKINLNSSGEVKATSNAVFYVGVAIVVVIVLAGTLIIIKKFK